jgi:hypothetical protein
MGSIPLPALDVQVQKPESLLNDAAQMEQIRASRQQQQAGELELQQKRMQIADQQAMTQAMHDWDGKDLNELPGLVLKRGGSANAVLGLRTSIVDQKTKLMNLDKDQLGLEAQKHDLVAGALSPLTDAKEIHDDQLPGAIHSTVQDLVQRGLIDPQHAQSAAMLAQMPPEQARQQIELFRKGMMGQKAQIEQAQSESETQKNTAQAQGARFKYENGLWYDLSSGQPKPVNATAADPQQFHDLIDQVAPDAANHALNMRTKANVDFLLKQGRVQDAQEAVNKAGEQVGAIEKELNPALEAKQIRVAQAGGQARAAAFGAIRQFPVFDNQTKQTVYLDSNELNDSKLREPGRYTVPSYSPEALGQKEATNYFVKGKGGQQLTAFNTAIAHLDLLDKLADDLNNTNVQIVNRAKQAWAEQTGNPAPANFAAATNAMSGEVASALKASGATDQEINKVGQTFSRAQAEGQIHGATGTYRSLLKSKRDKLKEQYDQGMQGKPNFGNQQAGSDPFAAFGGKAR